MCIDRRFQFFELALVEVPDLGLQRRLWDGAHLELKVSPDQ